jgi:hypothetical protein
MQNPFQYSGPLLPSQTVGRDSIIKQVIDLTTAGHNVRIPAPRDYGKTSMLKKALHEAEHQGIRPVYVDFYKASSYTDVATRISLAYENAYSGSISRSFKRLVDRIYFEINVTDIGKAGVELSVYKKHLLELLDIPKKYFEDTQKQSIIVFDEFQDFLKVDGDLDGLMRSVIQHHQYEAGYIFAGSEPSLLNNIFADKRRPFYGQSRHIELPRFERDVVCNYVEEIFNKSNRNFSFEAEKVFFSITRGHPQRSMMLAHFMFENTPMNKQCDVDIVEKSAVQVDKQLEYEFRLYWRSFTSNEQKTLQHVSEYQKALYNQEDLINRNLKKSTLNQKISDLVEMAEVYENSEGKYVLVDPFFDRWIKKANN